MTTDVQQVIDAALKLSTAERAAIADALLYSLDPVDNGTEAAILSEVESRIDAYDRGETPTIPVDHETQASHLEEVAERARALDRGEMGKVTADKLFRELRSR